MKFELTKMHPGTQLGRGVVIQRITEALQALPTDKAWTVSIELRRYRRTLPQNDKMHAMLGELASVLGYTLGELKRLLKNEMGAYVVVDGPMGKIKRLESSADWSKERMAEAIELLHQWAAMVGHRFSHD